MSAGQKAQSPGRAGLSAETKTQTDIVTQASPDRKTYETTQAQFGGGQ